MPEDLPRQVFIPFTFVVPNCEVMMSILSLYQIDHVTYLLCYLTGFQFPIPVKFCCG